jgi:hypothetical protein
MTERRRQSQWCISIFLLADLEGGGEAYKRRRGKKRFVFWGEREKEQDIRVSSSYQMKLKWR